MKDLISVIVPVYNVQNYILKCVDSIINQSYKNLEIILVDDGSTDESGKICDELALKDSRIKVIHKENGGLSDARNAGIEVSQGTYLGFIDSDDYIDNDMYMVLMSNLKNTNADISTCGRIIVTEGNESVSFKENEIICLNTFDAVKDLFVANNYVFHAAWDKLYKRELFSEIRFPVGRLFEDAAIMYRIFENAKKIVSTKKQLYYYIQRQGSISNCSYNKNKILHQFENRISAINYYKNINKEKCIFAKVWNLRTIEQLWKETYLNDKKFSEFLVSQTRRNFTICIYKYMSKKQFIKNSIFIINPRLMSLLKKSKIRNVKNKIQASVKRIKELFLGYFKNKHKYKNYDKNTIFILGIPEHGNRGDQAITVAEVDYITKLFSGNNIVLISENEWYENLLCIILFVKKYHNLCIFHGGGNMGELYPYQENIRLSAVRFLKKAKIIIFPQSIDYSQNSKQTNRAKRIYESHKNLTIFTREYKSEDLRKNIFNNCKGYMIPDIVMSYKPKIEDVKREGILFCVRNDMEKNAQTNTTIEILKQEASKYEKNIKYIDTYNKEYGTKYQYQLEGLNKLWGIFKKAEVVITDRLHGMIFSIITGTPCIALDNSTGKVGNYYRTWLKDSNVLFVNDQDGIDKALNMIENKEYKNLTVDLDLFKNNYSKLTDILSEN